MQHRHMTFSHSSPPLFIFVFFFLFAISASNVVVAVLMSLHAPPANSPITPHVMNTSCWIYRHRMIVDYVPHASNRNTRQKNIFSVNRN